MAGGALAEYSYGPFGETSVSVTDRAGGGYEIGECFHAYGGEEYSPLAVDQLGAARKAIDQGQRLSRTMKKSLRAQGQKTMEGVDAFKNSDKELAVHHIIPLEWSYVMGKGYDPNKLSNLAGVDQQTHNAINKMWTEFRTEWFGKTPTAKDVLKKAKEIEALYGSSYIR